VRLVPHDERDAGEADEYAGPLPRHEARVHPARRDDGGEKRLRRDDERRYTGGHAEVLRVVARAELHGVHENACRGEMAPFRGCGWPARLPDEDDRGQESEPEAKAQRQEGERRRVLQPDLGRYVARAPHRHEVPGEQERGGSGQARIPVEKARILNGVRAELLGPCRANAAT
jgi:hypothetical protein